jgi:hypothetical protein
MLTNAQLSDRNKNPVLSPNECLTSRQTGRLTVGRNLSLTLTFSYERVLRRQLEEQELVVRQSPTSKDVNTEAEYATALKAVTRRQPVKTQQAEKT